MLSERGSLFGIGFEGQPVSASGGTHRDGAIGLGCHLLLQDLLQIFRQTFAAEQIGLHPLKDVGHDHVEQHPRRQGEKEEHCRDHHGGDLVSRRLLRIGGHPHAGKDLADKQRRPEGRHKDGDVPVDGPIGDEAHLAEGFDEEETAAGC